jgi:hypothetical protein
MRILFLYWYADEEFRVLSRIKRFEHGDCFGLLSIGVLFNCSSVYLYTFKVKYGLLECMVFATRHDYQIP